MSPLITQRKGGEKVKLRIFAEEDRLKVAAILVRNGYRVSQGKEKRPSGRSYEYYIEAEDNRPMDKGNGD